MRMHVARTPSRYVDKAGNVHRYESVLVRRTYREGGKVKHETRLGGYMDGSSLRLSVWFRDRCQDRRQARSWLSVRILFITSNAATL
jgi:hypothetical protein